MSDITRRSFLAGALIAAPIAHLMPSWGEGLDTEASITRAWGEALDAGMFSSFPGSAVQVAAEQVRGALSLPEGYSVEVSEDGTAIIVSSGYLAFALTLRDIEDGRHVYTAQAVLPTLIRNAEAVKNGDEPPPDGYEGPRPHG